MSAISLRVVVESSDWPNILSEERMKTYEKVFNQPLPENPNALLLRQITLFLAWSAERRSELDWERSASKIVKVLLEHPQSLAMNVYVGSGPKFSMPIKELIKRSPNLFLDLEHNSDLLLSPYVSSKVVEVFQSYLKSGEIAFSPEVVDILELTRRAFYPLKRVILRRMAEELLEERLDTKRLQRYQKSAEQDIAKEWIEIFLQMRRDGFYWVGDSLQYVGDLRLLDEEVLVLVKKLRAEIAFTLKPEHAASALGTERSM